jgi:hypothetical protein
MPARDDRIRSAVRGLVIGLTGQSRAIRPEIQGRAVMRALLMPGRYNPSDRKSTNRLDPASAGHFGRLAQHAGEAGGVEQGEGGDGQEGEAHGVHFLVG